jgi:glycosyltransferase involved in cell wall biosynthesis
MRILIAGQTYYPAFNGQAIFTRNLAEGLAKRGHEVLVAVPSIPASVPQIAENGVQIRRIKSVPLTFIHSDASYTLFPSRGVQKVVTEYRPEIVHIHDHYPISRAMVNAARRANVKVIGTNHFMPGNLTPYIPIPDLFRPVVNWALWNWMLELYQQLDVVTAPSQTAAEIIRRQGLRRKVYPISCGVDTLYFRPDYRLDRKSWRQRYGLDPNRILFLFVGRVDSEKRLDVLIQAFKRLGRNDIEFGIVGRGAAQGKYRALVDELDLQNFVHFTGFVPDEDLPSLLNSADVFAMPSEAELLSIATIEAMACGLPILAARAQALPELVTDQENGLLFRAGDIDDAARSISLLADHPYRFSSMGRASLRKVQVHSLERTLRSYEKIYEMVCANIPTPSFATQPHARGLTKHSARGMFD